MREEAKRKHKIRGKTNGRKKYNDRIFGDGFDGVANGSAALGVGDAGGGL